MYGANTAAELIKSLPLTPTTNLPASMLGVTNTFNPLRSPAKYGPLTTPADAALNPGMKLKTGSNELDTKIQFGANFFVRS